MPRFVVLHHQPGGQSPRERTDPHFDWMFEVDGVLRTWATEPIASLDGPLEMPATRLSDHRLHYLDFEGEISGDRGTVQRVMAGTFVTSDVTLSRWNATISWTDQRGQGLSRHVEFYRNLSPICLSDDETRGVWCLRLDSCR